MPLPADEKEGFHNQAVERCVDALNGRKGLYSTVFYDRETFWRHHDGENYRELKKKCDPQGNLKDLFEKAVRG